MSHNAQKYRPTDDAIDEDLRDWFGTGKSGGVGGGGWDRYNTKGERIGKCAAPDRGASEGKPKCLSKQKAAQLRAKGGAKAIANAVKRKKAQDPVTNRKGTGNTPRYVSNRITENDEETAPVFTFEFEETTPDVTLQEKNVPTNPSLWSRAKSEAKKRFDVYPSAYANGWAAKWYKKRGGGWRTKKNESNTPSDREWGTDSLVRIYQHDTPGESSEDLVDAVHESLMKYAPAYSGHLVPSTTSNPISSLLPEQSQPNGLQKKLLQEQYEDWGELTEAAEYRGRKVQLGKPFRTPGGPKKFSVYVKNAKGTVVKVNFGDPNMEIRRDDPQRRKNFRSRHNCANPGPRWKARYWSCRWGWGRRKLSA